MLVKKLKADEEAHAKDLRDLLIENGILTNDLTNNMPAEEENEENNSAENQGDVKGKEENEQI